MYQSTAVALNVCVCNEQMHHRPINVRVAVPVAGVDISATL